MKVSESLFRARSMALNDFECPVRVVSDRHVSAKISVKLTEDHEPQSVRE
jgi:hypothetical protein